jgi:GH25 family lysozyme M1 (1,4-beta-N-acetylmuramidase)
MIEERLPRGSALGLSLIWLALAWGQPSSGEGPAPTPAAAPAPGRLVLGSQVTCVLGPEPTCAGEEAFQIPDTLELLASATTGTFGLRHGCLLHPDGTVLCWGCATEGQLGVPAESVSGRRRGRACRPLPAPPPGAPRLREVAAGWLHTCGVAHDGGGVVCWGDDSLDQLGRASPGPGVGAVEGLPEQPVTRISAGGVHTCAVEGDGAVVCWGDGSYGQLGQGELADSARPVAVQGLGGPATEVDAGAYHSCARLADGSVACWGDNRFGQLGDGTRTRRESAVAVQGLAGRVRAVEAGSSFTCAVLESGAVQCWGSNEMGELGGGFLEIPPLSGESPPPPPPPVTVKGLPGKVRELRLAGNHACAELEDGPPVCWGANEHGQLGDGTREVRDLPVPWQGRGPAPPTPSPVTGAGPLEGLDVSYHSGRVDWISAASAGHRFGLTLATAGDDFRDPFFPAHWARMRQAGLVRGAYHFFVAADDPEEQARTFLSHVVLEPGDLAPVVDVETLGGNGEAKGLPDKLRAFLAEVERAIGVKPIIYTSPNFWDAQMHGEFGDYPLWIAEYGVKEPRVPSGWKRWHLWQYRGNAELPHIAPVVDLDRLAPGVELKELLIPEPPPEEGD